MKFTVNKGNTTPKKNRTIIKCKDCGFKYYDGDVHKCIPGGVKKGVKEETEDKPKEKKLTVKSQKESFKIWKDGEEEQ